jgi:hypothetical protein
MMHGLQYEFGLRMQYAHGPDWMIKGGGYRLNATRIICFHQVNRIQTTHIMITNMIGGEVKPISKAQFFALFSPPMQDELEEKWTDDGARGVRLL